MPLSETYRLLFRVFYSLLIALFLLSAAHANTSSNKQIELKKLQKQIQKLQQTIETKQNSKSQYVKQLRSIEKNIGSLNKKIKKSSNLIKSSQKELNKLQKQKKSLIKTLDKNKKILSQQILGAYTQGNHSHLQMIFNQQDPATFQRQLSFYQYITEQQSNTIKIVNQNIDELKQTEQAIAFQTKQYQQSKKDLENQRSNLKKDRSKRQNIVSHLDKELSKQGKKLKSLNEDAEQLKQLIESINEIFKEIPDPKIPFAQLKGKLPWPLKGELKTMYGRLKPLSNLKWQGNVIYAPNGRHVRAISNGRVAYADWLKGFGNIIILDHGDGYLSLYGHNESLFKNPGDLVSKGEIISSAGNSGGISKSGIYFEIRKKGKPQNPAIWCRKKNNFIS